MGGARRWERGEREREREREFFSPFFVSLFSYAPNFPFFFVKDFSIFFRFFHPQTESAYYKTEQNAPFFFFLSLSVSLSLSLYTKSSLPPRPSAGFLGPAGEQQAAQG